MSNVQKYYSKIKCRMFVIKIVALICLISFGPSEVLAQVLMKQNTYTYTSFGDIDTIDGPRSEPGVSDLTDFEYDPISSRLESITYGKNELDLTYTYSNYNYLGNAQTIVNPNQIETTYLFDPNGNLTSTVIKSPSNTPSLDSITIKQVNSLGQVTCLISADGEKTIISYTDARYVSKVIEGANDCDEQLNTEGNLKKYEYNDNGDLLSVVIFNGLSINNPITFQRTYTYDELGRKISESGNYGDLKTFSYNSNDFLIEKTEVVNSQSSTRSNSYIPDNLGRPKYLDDAYLNRVQNEYDSEGRLNSVTDTRGNTTSYVYDSFSYLQSLSSPETGYQQFVHDAAGNLITETNGVQVKSQRTYDGVNRLTSISYPQNSIENQVFFYDDYSMDSQSDPAESDSYPKGLLTGFDSQHSNTRYYYDHRGNITKKKTTISQQEYEVESTFSLADKLNSITYPGGIIVYYTYDSKGRVNQITASFQSKTDTTPQLNTIVQNVDYKPFGPIEEITFGNGTRVNNTWNLDYKLQGTKLFDPSSTLLKDRTYIYDAVGNVTAINDSVVGESDFEYEYDLLDRITKSSDFTSTLPSYQYDSAGNRIEFKNIYNLIPLTSDYSVAYKQDSNRIDTITFGSGLPQNVLYDSYGNITQRDRSYIDENGNHVLATDTFGYNESKRLISADVVGTIYSGGVSIDSINIQVTYKYSANGERVETTSTDGSITKITHFVYDNVGKLLQTSVTESLVGGGTGPTLVTNWIYLDEVAVAQLSTVNNATDGVMVGSYELFTFYSNHLGVAEMGFNSVGDTIWRRTITAFGEYVETIDLVGSGDQTIVNNQIFPGQHLDSSTGLYYNYFRDYDPSLGRYIQSDPIGLRGGINTYIYTEGNPVSFVDPLGLETCLLTTVGPLGVRDHAALYMSRGDGKGGPVLFDPAGSYGNANGGGTSGILEGDAANIEKFRKYHDGTEVETACKDTSQKEEEDIVDKALELPSARPFQCARRASDALSNQPSFPNVEPDTFWPGNVRRQILR